MDFLNDPRIDALLEAAFTEDVGTGDVTTAATVPPGKIAEAVCKIKADGVLAGVALAEKIYHKFDSGVEFIRQIEDGARVKSGDEAFRLRGKAATLLTLERLTLNLMQRMSGIATQTRAVCDVLAGTNCRVLDTRKTTPLIRIIEKWAVQIGGGVNHRFGLYDMILIKDNHIDCAGGVRPALEAAHAYLSATGQNLPIVVETRNETEVEAVLAVSDSHGVTRILLDNMSPEKLRACVQKIGGRFPTEASGSLTLENARAVAETGVDFLSMGALTHSVRAMDISLKIVL